MNPRRTPSYSQEYKDKFDKLTQKVKKINTLPLEESVDQRHQIALDFKNLFLQCYDAKCYELALECIQSAASVMVPLKEIIEKNNETNKYQRHFFDFILVIQIYWYFALQLKQSSALGKELNILGEQHLEKVTAYKNYLNPLIELPKKFHIIWLGSPIPTNYLRMIHHLNTLCQISGFEINLWVDHSRNYTKRAIEEDLHCKGLRIRDIEELFQKIKEDPFYQVENRCKRFQSYVLREMVGFKNLAAASDILRIEILRQEGGYYLDTDITFEFDKNNTHLQLDKTYTGFLFHGKQTKVFKSITTNNDILASIANGVLIQEILIQLLNNYQKLDNTEIANINLTSDDIHRNYESFYLESLNLNPIEDKPANTTNHFFRKMDLKRKPGNDKLQKINPDCRFNLTLTTSGPGAINNTLDDYFQIPFFMRNLLFFKIHNNKVMIANKPSVEENTSTALSWVVKRMPKQAFDDYSAGNLFKCKK